MKEWKQVLAVASVAAVLSASPSRLEAQDQQPEQPPQRRQGGGGNFDPEQMRQRMMERYREQLEVTSDEEWKLIQERIEKVTQARRDVGATGGMGGFGGGRQGGRGGGDGNAPEGRRGGRGGFGAQPSPEMDALQKAVESKASPEELQAKLAKFRDARKEKEAKLDAAQAELRKVLSVRQEATAVLAGLLK